MPSDTTELNNTMAIFVGRTYYLHSIIEPSSAKSTFGSFGGTGHSGDGLTHSLSFPDSVLGHLRKLPWRHKSNFI